MYFNVCGVTEETAVLFAPQADWSLCSHMFIPQEWYLFWCNVLNTAVFVCFKFCLIFVYKLVMILTFAIMRLLFLNSCAIRSSFINIPVDGTEN
jgi:hypothetical protein